MKKLLNIAFLVVVIGGFIFFLQWLGHHKPYSFFVAGHVYGNAQEKNRHIHPPFMSAYPYILSTPGISFGVLTGDVVKKSEPVYFETFLAGMDSLGLPYYIAPGNHDIGNRELYESLFGDRQHDHRSFGAFTFENDLFLLLDGNLDRESITGEQLDFMRSTLDHFGEKSRNIFVFVHQLIWRNDANEFSEVVINWPPNAPDTNNYWSVVEPMLVATKKPVFLFAGDLGGNQIATPFMYHVKNGLTYVAGGMGQGKDDNFLLVHVSADGEVELELVALQGARDRLGRLQDHLLP